LPSNGPDFAEEALDALEAGATNFVSLPIAAVAALSELATAERLLEILPAEEATVILAAPEANRLSVRPETALLIVLPVLVTGTPLMSSFALCAFCATVKDPPLAEAA
jgi:hypothetical protein